MHSVFKNLQALFIFIILIASIGVSLAQNNAGIRSRISAVAYSPDGNKIAVAGGNFTCASPDISNPDLLPYAISIVDASTNLELTSILAHHCNVTGLAWSPDGNRLASTSEDGSAIVHNALTGVTIAAIYNGSQSFIAQPQWNSNGTLIADFDPRSNAVRIWDASNGNALALLQEPNATYNIVNIAWSPNSLFIATIDDADNIRIWDVSNIATTGTSQITATYSGVFAFSLVWNPNSDFLALGSVDKVLILNVQTGEVAQQLLGPAGPVVDIAWSPIDNRVVAVSLDNSVYLWDTIGGFQIEVIETTTILQSVDWHPNGEFIAFGGMSNDGQEAHVQIEFVGLTESFSLLASDNSIISEPLANNAELSNLPASVKFRANTNPATVGSVVFSLNGQVVGTSNTAPYDLNWTPLVGQHSLTATPYSGANGTGTAGSPYTVNFSVTGNLNRILFRHNNHIYIMNADGSNPVDLGAGESPSFSPDGSQIAFQLNGTGGREIYLMNADGTNRRQLTNNNIDDRNPSWSPDGSRIVYCSVITGADWELWIMNVDGSNKVQITHNSTDDADPVWSSNDVIAFSALTGSYRQIFTIWSDGSHRTLLTSGNSNKLGPEWSPDGSQLVYNSSGVTNEDIYRINADGTGGLRLTNHASSDIDADWSPDGSQIIFSSDRAGGANRELYRMNADGSAETRFTFTSFDEIQPAWGYP